MPGVYKKKECPTCGTTHRNRGMYCNIKCFAARKKTKEETERRAVATSKRMRSDTPTAERQRWELAQIANRTRALKQGKVEAYDWTGDELMVVPEEPLDRDTFIADGAIWKEDDQF